jgi:hypothetical protein
MLIATVAIALTATASAGVIGASHSGSNDPETEHFTVQNAASGSADGGSWSMTTGGAGRYISDHPPAGGADHTLTATGRWISSGGTIGTVIMWEPDADKSAQLAFNDDGSGIWARGGTGTYAVDTTVDHTYQITYSETSEGPVQKAYVDGNFAFDLFIGEWAGLDNFDGGFFVGSASSAQPGSSAWSTLQVETGLNVIPEPSALLLLAAGLVGLLGIGRQR